MPVGCIKESDSIDMAASNTIPIPIVAESNEFSDHQYQDASVRELTPFQRCSSGVITSVLTYVSIMGPGYSIAVGYIDPGNWVTSIAAGSGFGYKHLFVILVANLTAMFIQMLAMRFGLVTKRDLAQQCRLSITVRPLRWAMYLAAEIAICATDLAEVIGSAIALNLLFSIPLYAGVLITAADVFVILAGVGSYGKTIEFLVGVLFLAILCCFTYLLINSDVVYSDLFQGYLPSTTLITDQQALYIGIGIVGAVVMPHNLYLHSHMVIKSSHRHPIKTAIRSSSVDIILSLTLAFIVNSSILAVASSNFHSLGLFNVQSLEEAHSLLERRANGAMAAIFAVSLLLAGQSSTITGTIAGQVVAEGFVHWRMKPWVRRLITRLLAIVPALVTILCAGPDGLNDLLVLSQVILSMQLPFAFFPLIYFAGNKELMGPWAIHIVQKLLGYSLATLIVCLNGFLILQTMGVF